MVGAKKAETATCLSPAPGHGWALLAMDGNEEPRMGCESKANTYRTHLTKRANNGIGRMNATSCRLGAIINAQAWCSMPNDLLRIQGKIRLNVVERHRLRPVPRTTRMASGIIVRRTYRPSSITAPAGVIYIKVEPPLNVDHVPRLAFV